MLRFFYTRNSNTLWQGRLDAVHRSGLLKAKTAPKGGFQMGICLLKKQASFRRAIGAYAARRASSLAFVSSMALGRL
jgi:hypothetical protein